MTNFDWIKCFYPEENKTFPEFELATLQLFWSDNCTTERNAC